ncbi:hypothetical protein LSCM1_06248 [Leishmania martiniquensis]|uniref:C-CAP/cofactor C-like domain-containing protein n=1 Tax=Leishmania martiniquensis TaxID=1580590 RepID=A0A836KM32_9TRYP|nr:hypothetical protein LSCM1_06248 [Leishmania martiniquensis]
MRVSPAADTSMTASVYRSPGEQSIRAVAAGMLVDTGSNGIAASPTRLATAQATVWSTAPDLPWALQRPPSTSTSDSLPSDSPLLRGALAAAVHRSAAYSSFDDASDENVDEDELNSSEVSRAAQAALDSVEQLRRNAGVSDSSPALTAMTEHSFSVTPSLTLAQMETSSPPPPPMQVRAPEDEVDTADKGRDATVAGLLVSSDTDPVETPLSRGRELVCGAECYGIDGATAAVSSGVGGTSCHTAAARRQPPPPPTPSTTTKKSSSSPFSLRRGVQSDESASSGASSSDTEVTVKQQGNPVTAQGASTAHETPAEATRVVANYSASLLPPNRSSSTASHSSDRLEGTAAGESIGSATAPSTAVMAGGTLMGSGREGVIVGGIAPHFKEALSHHVLQPAPTSEMHDEMQIAATTFTTRTRGGEPSSQRPCALLMPPSPSQPRATMIPDDSFSSSPSFRDINAAVFAGPLDRSNSDQALLDTGRDVAAQPSKGDAKWQGLVMRRASGPNASSASFSSGGGGSNGREIKGPLGNRRTSGGSREHVYVEKRGCGSDRSSGPPSTADPSAVASDAICTTDGSAAHAGLLQYTEDLDAGDACEREAEDEDDETLMSCSGAEEQNGNPLLLQEAGRWDGVLAEMELVDCTVVSRVYQRAMPRQPIASLSEREDDVDNTESGDGEDFCLFKVVSPFPMAAAEHGARWPQRTRLQRRLLALAEEMRATQRALDKAGLTAATAEWEPSPAQHMGAGEKAANKGGEVVDGGEGSAGDVFAQRRRRTTCAGVSEVYVDSRCRLIAQLEVAPYMVPLRHVVAASCGAGLRECEVLALIRSVVCKVATMHNAGFVHGALHAGNVLLSSYDGDAVLTQPCGLLSQSLWLPCDLSVISVARADFMASYLPDVWGAHRLNVEAAAATRRSPQQRPSAAELITGHSLAALGWLNGDDSRESVEPDGRPDSCESSVSGAAYVPTAADDLYAVAMITFLIYLGIPPFHMASLWAVVERLGVLGEDYRSAMQSSSSSPTAARLEARRLVAEFCFGTRRREADRKGGHAQTEEGAPLSSAEFMQLPDLLTRTCGAMQHHAVAPFRPDFERALQSFIVDCLEASCIAAALRSESVSLLAWSAAQRVYADAQELLTDHPLFQVFTLPAQAGEEDEEEVKGAGDGQPMVEEESQLDADERMRDTVHRVTYPAFCTWARARDDCGSAPHLSRLHSNAFFTARCKALCEHVSTAAPNNDAVTSDSQNASRDGESRSVLSVLSPHMAGTPPAWQPPIPYAEAHNSCRQGWKVGTDTCQGTSTDAAAAISQRQCPGDPRAGVAAAWPLGFSSLVRPSAAAVPAWLAALAEQQEGAVAAQLFSGEGYRANSSFVYYPHLRTLALSARKGGIFSLSRTFLLSRVLPVADTLVLQRLADCKVTLLAPFRYVVLDAVQRCEVRLGPCESCVLRDVHDCQLIAVAARELSGNNVTETHLSWSAQGSGRLLLKCSRGVATSLYGLVYEGLVEDYSRVGLPLEHAACFAATANMIGDGTEGEDAVGFRAPVLMRRRSVELLSTTATIVDRNQVEAGLCLAPEAPYAHALLLSDSRYVHSGRHSGGPQRSWTSPPDIFHFYGELVEKDVVVCDVHGGTRDGDARPVVFVVGALGDVVVERCSYCTIVVAGTPSNLQAFQCHNCRLVFMARESVVEDCAQVECVALVTEYLLLRRCDAVRVRPLFLDCPFSDEVLRRVVDGSVGGAEEEMVIGAYEGGRLDELNAVLRGVGQGVHLENSQNVVVEDLAYFHQLSGRDGDGEDVEGDGVGDGDGIFVLSVTYASTPSPPTAGMLSSDASQLMVDAAQSLAEYLSVPCYVEPLQRYGGDKWDASSHACRPAVSFHDLLNCSVLRLRESLCPLKPQVSSSSRDLASTLVDMCVERVHGGVIYVEDAVHTLYLRHCVGPLDVVVCAATTVLMEACVGVQLRTACASFRATDCVDCHVALHVNSSPQYQRCRSVQASALNITAWDFDALLSTAGVDLATNLYDAPLLLTEEWEGTVAVGPSRAPSGTGAAHGVDGSSLHTSSALQSTADICAVLLASVHREERRSPRGGLLSGRPGVSPDQLPHILSVLHQPVTIVAPLPGLCVSPTEAPFLEELETRVAAWAKRPFSVSREEAVAVALYALADLAEAYTGFTELAEATDSAQPTEAPGLAAAIGASLDPDAPPELLITRAPPSPSSTSSAPMTTSSVPRPASDAVEQRRPSTDQQQLLQAEMRHIMGNTQTSTPAAAALLDVFADERGSTAEENSVEGIAMHHAPASSPPSPPAYYADHTRVLANCNAHALPPGAPRAAPVALHWPPESGSSPMRARHGELASFESATLPCATTSGVASSAAGLDCAASAIEGDTSVTSSVAAPPLPPGPAYALAPTNFGASSTMDVFYRTQRDGTSVATGTTGPLMEEDEGAGHTSASPGPDHTRSPVISGGCPTLVSPMASSDGHVGTWSGRQASTVAETLGAVDAEGHDSWLPSSKRSPRRMTLDPRNCSNGDELLNVTAAHGSTNAAAGGNKPPATLLRVEGIEPAYAGNAAHVSLRTSSSSVAEYPRRGVTSYESSAEHAEGSGGGGTEESPLPQTNFLYVSQDSSSRRLELNSPAATMTPLTVMEAKGGDVGEHGIVCRVEGAVAALPAGGRRAMASADLPAVNRPSDVTAMREAGAGMKEVLRRLEQARQVFARNQRSWQSPTRGGLEARVRAAVAKLTASKATRAKGA